MDLFFTVPGEPKGKGRPRFSRKKGKVNTYTPKSTADYEELIQQCYICQCGNKRFEDGTPLTMAIKAYYGIPKSGTKKEKDLMARDIKRPTKRPDLDNVVKVVADSLNGLAYKDDAQITDIKVEKHYSYNPMVEVWLGD